MQLAAFAMLWARGGEAHFFLLSNAICGIALGISWTIWPLIVTLHFPGGSEAVQINFGIVRLFPSLSLSPCCWFPLSSLTFLSSFSSFILQFFLAIAIFCPVLSACTDRILLATAPTIAGCEIVDGVDFRGASCYDTVFLAYTMFALLALMTSSAAAAILIHRKIKMRKDDRPELQQQDTVGI